MFCLSSFGLEMETSQLVWSLFSRFRNVRGFEFSVNLLHSQLDDYTSKKRDVKLRKYLWTCSKFKMPSDPCVERFKISSSFLPSLGLWKMFNG